LSVDPWLPVGYGLPGGEAVKRLRHEGVEWQIVEIRGGGHALIVKESLGVRWVRTGMVGDAALARFRFGRSELRAIGCTAAHTLAPVVGGAGPRMKSEALAFADAMRATREVDQESSLHDAIYVERLSRLLPTYSLSPPCADDVVLGTWLSDGVPVSVNAFRRLRSLVGWMDERHLLEVIGRAGFAPRTTEIPEAVNRAPRGTEAGPGTESGSPGRFVLAGRPKLEEFLNEHVVEIIANRERYTRLGIGFPAPIILHGPPGCGKTFAVERLIEFLGWPSFAIEASSVASPYIHETSRKVAEIFTKATENAPSVLVIDEMEAFLADRERGAASSHHRVEEVAEFLRRIPEASENDVLVVAMTNRIEMIDPAILRRGRFDHVVKVEMASEEEVRRLLEKLIAELPHEGAVEVGSLAKQLAGRPLSDVSFVIRESARLAARAGKTVVDQSSLQQALEGAPARESDSTSPRRIGFR